MSSRKGKFLRVMKFFSLNPLHGNFPWPTQEVTSWCGKCSPLAAPSRTGYKMASPKLSFVSNF